MSAMLDMVENVEKPDGLTGEDLVNTGDGRVMRTHSMFHIIMKQQHVFLLDISEERKKTNCTLFYSI